MLRARPCGRLWAAGRRGSATASLAPPPRSRCAVRVRVETNGTGCTEAPPVDMTAQLTAAQAEILRLQRELLTAQQAIREAQDGKAAADRQVTTAEQQLDRLGAHLEQVEVELEEVRTSKFDMEEAAKEARLQVAKLGAALTDMKANHDAAAQEITAQQGEIRRLRTEMGKQRDKADTFRAEAMLLADRLRAAGLPTSLDGQ